MKNTRSLMSIGSGRFYRLLCACLWCSLCWTTGQAQCSMTCSDSVPVSLDQNCEATILPDMILEGLDTNPCLGPFVVEIFDANGQLIPTNPLLGADYIGQSLRVRVIDQSSTNFCEGSIEVSDGLPPVISQCDDYSLPCAINEAPVAGAPTTLVFNESLNPASPIGPDAGHPTLIVFSAATLPANAYVVDVEVAIDLSHPNSAELDVSLSGPNQQVVVLANDVCDGDANWEVTFDDEAVATFPTACNTGNTPVLSGLVQPVESLSTFDDQIAQGAWTLTVEDDTDGQGGILNSATLTISYTLLAAYQPVATDACGTATLAFSDEEILGTCSDPFDRLINRTWTATDEQNNSTQCVQSLTFLRPTLNGIAFPPNYDGQVQAAFSCEEEQSDPGSAIIPEVGWNSLANGHPSPYPVFYDAPNQDIVKWIGTGVPIGADCGDLSFTFEDQRIPICDASGSEACFKILRQWIVTDHCTGQIEEGFQVLKVVDEIPPQISGLADLTISTAPTICAANWVATVPLLNDNCVADSELSYVITSSVGTVVELANGQFELQNIPLGDHLITYEASDCCGNSSSSRIQLTVVDDVPPVAVCDKNTQVTLLPDGTAKIFASTFDDQSHDNCGPVFFKVIRMDEYDSNGNGQFPETVLAGDWEAIDCDGANGDDDLRTSPPFHPNYNKSQAYFDDYIKFCCADARIDSVRIVLRVFDVDPGEGPVLPERMAVGGDLFGRHNECMVNVRVFDKLPPILRCPPDVTLLCTQNDLDTALTGVPEAFDNCSLDTLFFNDVPDLNMCNVGTIFRTWTAEDHEGRRSLCTQLIELIDTTTPVFFFPPDTVVSCGASMEPKNTGEAFGMDDCSVLGVSFDDLLFEFPDSCTRKVLREWSILDWCTGQVVTQLQVIKEFDDLPPILIGVPPNDTVDCDIVPPVPVVTAEDNCDRDVEITFLEERIDGDCPYNYLLIRTWMAFDNCDNMATAIQEITVQDTTAPIITGVPADMTLECDQFPVPPAMPTASDNCTTVPELTFMEVREDGICLDNFTIVRTWTATDSCSNSTVLTQRILFEDTTPPILGNIPPDITLTCEEPLPPSATLTASDNCDPDPIITMTEVEDIGSCADSLTVIRTWTATDRCGNTSTVSQAITFQDNTAPILDNIPPNESVECDRVPDPAMPTASDNCDPNPDISLVEDRIDGFCEDTYELIRTWTATDRCGNTSTASQVITVSDNGSPELMGAPGNLNLSCDEAIPPIATVTAMDNCDPNPLVFPFEETLAGDCPEEFRIIRTWTATDRCGNINTATQIISVVDDEPPVLMNIPDDITAECVDVSNPVVTAMDNCDVDVTVTVMEISGGPCDGDTPRILVWTATDNCGNSMTASQVITLEDTTPPVITDVPPDMTVSCDDIPLPMDPMAMDTCTGVTLTFEERETLGDCRGESLITRIWTAMDACGNIAVDSQLLVVIDTTPPVILGIPNDVNASCTNVPDPPMPGTVTSIDNCDTLSMLQLQADTLAGTCPQEFTIIRIWVAEDDCGNVARDTQFVFVTDTGIPVLDGIPADTLVLCDSIPEFPDIGVDITAMDDCDLEVSIALEVDTIPGTCASEFTLLRIWEAIDDCGNSSRDTQLISVVDTLAPVIIGVPEDTTILCDAFLDIPIIGTAVTAVDNCDTLPVLQFVADTIPGTCENEFTVLRIWFSRDTCGNNSRDTQLVFVIDTIAPIIFGVPEDTTLLCSDDFQLPMIGTDITAVDNCDTLPDVSFRADTLAGNCAEELIILRIWSAADDCGNVLQDTQVVSVIDTLPPLLIGIPTDTTVLCDAVPDPPTIGIGAIDNCDPNPMIVLMADTLTGNCAQEPIILRIWTATDACGNISRDTQRLFLLDTLPPIISGLPDDITVACDAVPDPPTTGIIARDNCDALPTIDLVADTLVGICAQEGSILRIWIAEDACGNMARDTQRISIIDTLAPTLMGIPADTLIACDQIDLPLAVVTAQDNCDTLVNLTERRDTLSGDCPNEFVIIRSWEAIDACGNITRDSQRVMLTDTVAPILINVPSDITADCRAIPDPPQLLAMDNCDTLSMVTLRADTTGPCAHTFEIIRTWTARDACGNSSQASQTIMVVDTIAPSLILPVTPDSLELNQGDSCDIFFALIAGAIDNCDDAVTITHDFAEASDPFSTSGDASGDFPLGNTIVRFTATDACGNSTVDSVLIKVVDAFGPAFLCESFSDTVDANTGYFVIQPDDLMTFAEDLCSPPVIKSFSPLSSSNPQFDTLRCEDGPTQFVFVQVTDAAGITNVCGVGVTILEPFPGFCGLPPLSGTAIVAGQISTEQGAEVEGVDVEVNGGMSMSVETSANGFFVFEGLPQHYNYTVAPYKNDDPLNGVSTYDLVMISRHILGVQPLASPYQRIAADIDGSGTISTFDLVALRRLILFIDDQFQSNESWRFVDADYIFSDPNDPFQSAFPEVYTINDLEEHLTDAHFVGVKVGDVNGSVQANALMAGEALGRQAGLELLVKDQYLRAGAFYDIEVKANHFEDLLGCQFQLGADPAKLQIEAVEELNTRINWTPSAFQLSKNNRLTASWGQAKPQGIPSGEHLFRLRIRALEDGLLSQALQLEESKMQAESYPSDLSIQSIQLRYLSNEQTLTNTGRFILYQNRPNPFSEETIIAFELPQAKMVYLTIYDLDRNFVITRFEIGCLLVDDSTSQVV
ncbi:MAG: proprotein convertase P-domain-containing protein, partial [Bacteroidota bacterium]